MKRVIILLAIFIFLDQEPEPNMINNELPLLVQIDTEEGVDLEQWRVIGIDLLSIDDFDNITNSLQNSYFITVSNEENAVKYIFESRNKDSVEHFFQAIISHNNANQVTFKTIISGDEWDKQVMNDYIQLTTKLQDDYNIMFVKNFTCLQFGLSGIINNGLLFDEIWKKMKVTKKIEQYDNVQHSTYKKEIYGYSPLWENELTVNDEQINFHIVLKNKENNKGQVIIGTPMILSEY